MEAKTTAPLRKDVVPLPFEVYAEAGGIFSKEDYDRVVGAHTEAMNGGAKPQRVHMRQAEVLGAKLPSEEAKDVAHVYAVLMEAEKYGLNPDLVPKGDQRVFAEALLMTQGPEAYQRYIINNPHIFKPQA